MGGALIGPLRDSLDLRVWLIGLSARRAPMAGMRNEHPALDDRARTAKSWPSARTLGAPVPTPTGDPVARLSAALQILATQLSETVAERRGAPPGGERYRRADERVAYLNELYVRLQRRMEVPVEIWLLDGDSASDRGWRSRRPHPR